VTAYGFDACPGCGIELPFEMNLGTPQFAEDGTTEVPLYVDGTDAEAHALTCPEIEENK
jgi:hypothetical protein